MLAKKYLIGAEWINNLMILLLYFVSGEFFAYLLGYTLGVRFLFMSLIVIFCSYLCRVYIEKLLVFLAAHILMYACLILMPISFRLKFSTFIMLTILTVCDLFFWTGGTDRSFIRVHPVLSLIFAAVFIYASLKQAPYPERISYVCGICFLSLYFLRTYLLNGAGFASGMLINKNTPIDEMFKYNSRLVFPLVGGFTACMFLIQSETLALWLSTAVRFIMNCLGRFLSFLFSLIPRSENEEQVIIESQGKVMLPKTGSAPVWLITLLGAVEKVVSIFVIGLIIYYIIKLIVRFFIMYFERHGYEIMTVKLEDHEEIREKIRHDKRGKVTDLIWGMSERERIRRKYRSAVIRMSRRGYLIKRAQTPAERAADIAVSPELPGTESFAELTERYEKIRYFE